MGESQNGFFKKTKHAKFSEKRNFITKNSTLDAAAVLDPPLEMLQKDQSNFEPNYFELFLPSIVMSKYKFVKGFTVNPFHVAVHFLRFLKTSENFRSTGFLMFP